MADSTTVTTAAPSWTNPFKKQFIIYNRTEDSDTRIFPDLTQLTDGDRTAFVFDTVNRNIIKHEGASGAVKPKNTILAGHTEINGTGRHNEIFCDYNNNKTVGVVSYALVTGTGNISKYSTSSGSFTTGHWNKPDTSYLVTVGNGLSDTSRSNIVTITDESVTIGYSSSLETGKNVSIKNGTVVIGGDLTVNGKINGESSGGGGGNYDAEIAALKSSITELQNQLTTLQTSYTNLYETFEDMYHYWDGGAAYPDWNIIDQIDMVQQSANQAELKVNQLINTLDGVTLITT